MSASFEVRVDCRHYRGDRPCFPGYVCTADCDRYESPGRRVLVIKVGALGDVVRTTPLLSSLPLALGPVHITWITHPAAAPLLRGLDSLARVWTIDDPLLPCRVAAEKFDLAICLEKEPDSCCIMAAVQAAESRGYTLDERGAVVPVDSRAEYLWRLGLDDNEKFFVNQKTYPVLVHEAIGLDWSGEPYRISLPDANRERAQRHLEQMGVLPARNPVVGFQTGAGGVFANKEYTVEGLARVIDRLVEDAGIIPVLLGGPQEVERNRAVVAAVSHPVFDAGVQHDIVTFAGIVSYMDVVLAGDTLAMHLALALGRRVVAIFGPTCAQEIELFGLGEKVITPAECSPCYRRSCDIEPSCMDLISPATVVEALVRQLARISEGTAP